jgi:hypothetical protein
MARAAGLVAATLAACAAQIAVQAAPGYTVLDASGQALSATPAAPMRAACVRDEQSGLTWALKTSDGGLNDRRWTYTPYDGNPATNGGYAGYRDTSSGQCPRDRMRGRSCNTEAFIEAVKASALCGYGDWRLPTYTELAAIASQTTQDSAAHSTLAFPDIEEGWYWTAVAKIGVTSFSRVVLLPPRARPQFYDGSYLVMAVRGP